MAWNLPHTGELRNSVRFDRAVEGENVGGVTRTTWTQLIDQRAVKLDPTRGGDEVIAGRLEGKSSYDLWVRSDSSTRGLQVGDRAVDRKTGLIYALGEPIDPNNRRQWLLIQATSNGRTS
jgi:hypothetical protein